MSSTDDLRGRRAPLDLTPEQFKTLGHDLVERLGDLLATLPDRPVTRGESPGEIRRILGDHPLPETGGDPTRILSEVTEQLLEHSLFNGHPRFMGYITSSPAPLGILGDLLASSVNPNLGGYQLSPLATEIEAQTVRWIADLVGYPATCGGLLSSGGNMANFIGFLAGRRHQAGWDYRKGGMGGPEAQRLRVYCSGETHTWIQKACDLFGLGTDAIRWIPVDASLRMDMRALRRRIAADRAAGDTPAIVVGTGGSVSTGAVDPLPEIAALCREEKLWFHVDGAYGGVAAVLPDAPEGLKGLSEADSVAVDPHKWLYAPIEAGCTLVRDPKLLVDTFGYKPPYYHLERGEAEPPINYYEHGPQNTRGFRALKVWLGLKQVGREGYIRMIRDDIRLSDAFQEFIEADPELEAVAHGLSINAFRYVPADVRSRGLRDPEEYLNRLNTELLTRLQLEGEMFPSNAVLNGRYCIRTCIVNFRTSLEDIQALPGIVKEAGKRVDKALRDRP